MKISAFKKNIAFFCFLFAINADATQPSSDSTDLLVNKNITQWMKKNNIPGVAVEIYKNGKPHSYYYGYANLEKKIPITNKTIFEVGSFTKIFTCILIADEINRGEMKLDDSISKYLPNLSTNNHLKNVTLKNLGTYTSSLPFSTPSDIKTKPELQKFLMQWKPSSTIGSNWDYSNMSIGLLGLALEEKTKKSLNELYRTRILQPLHMELIGMTVPKQREADYAQGYSSDGKIAPHTTSTLFPAAASIKASGHDMLQFLKAAVGSSDTPDNIATAMLMTQTPYARMSWAKQGLSWVIYPITQSNKATLLNPSTDMPGPTPAIQLDDNEQIFNGNTLVDKTGGTDGFRSYIAVIPNEKLGIVILTNRFVSHGEIVKIGRDILFSLNNEL